MKRVTSPRAARAPGRVPRRTNRIGAGAAWAISARVGPRPSRRQRSDRPITSTHAPAAASSTPARPGSAMTGSDSIPANRCTSSAASASRREASRPSASPAAPSSFSVARLALAIHAPSSSAAQSCSAPPKGTSTGASAPHRMAWSSRATSTATSQGAFSRTAPTLPRGTPRPSSGRRPSMRIRSTASSWARRTRSWPGSVEVKATARAGTPRRRRSARAARTAAEAALSARRSVWSPPRTAAPRGGSSSRARISSRGGWERARGSASATSAGRAASVCGATSTERSGMGP